MVYFSSNYCDSHPKLFTFPHKTGRGGLGVHCSSTLGHKHRSKEQQMSAFSSFLHLDYMKSRAESGQGKKSKWLAAPFGWSVHLATFRNTGSFPKLLSHCQVHVLKFAKSATHFIAWMYPNFRLLKQMLSVSATCLYTPAVAGMCTHV